MNVRAEEKIFQLFKRTINASFELGRSDGIYQLTENGVPYEFRAPSDKCFAFRIDDSERKIMLAADGASKEVALFGGSPPAGVAKMCDAIFIVSDNDKDYIIFVEIKTGHDDGYKKQMKNGWRFYEWIMNLLRDHQHCSKQASCLGLLVWKAERSTDGTKQTLIPNRYEKRGTHGDMVVFEAFDRIISMRTLLNSARKGN